jgi:hypothetical protein
MTLEEKEALVARIDEVIDHNDDFAHAPVLYMFGALDAFRKAKAIIMGEDHPHMIDATIERRVNGTRMLD